MASGLKVWKPDGAVIIDTTTRMGSFVGEILTTSSPGSQWVTVPEGEFFYYVIPVEGKIVPVITYTAGLISWAAPPGYDLFPALVVYGVF